ncbi:MAG: heme o synthase [Pseudomonadota bacterium]
MSTAVATPSTLSRYLGLCKLKVVSLIVFTAIVGMALSVQGMVPWQPLLIGSLGIGLAASSAAAINHLLDARADQIMARTRNRPLPMGELNERQVLIFALALAVISMVLLVVFINVLTAVLTFASLIGYAVIYTAWLKRATPQNIVIGGAAGAAPPVLGWAAVTGEVHAYSLILFLIVFVWTPPHFWALAIYRRHDYEAADVPMLPVTHGVEFTRLQILFYSIILVLVTLLPFLTGMSGLVYLVGTTILNIGFMGYALAMMKPKSEQLAMQMFSYSVVYLMALFAFLLVDHYITI